MLNRIASRILAMVGIGRVTTSNDASVMQTMQVRFNDMQLINNMPRMMEFGFTSALPDGTDVLALFMGGDKSNGVIIASNHQASRPTGLANGESAVFNLVGIKIYLSSTGLVIEGAGLPVTINNAPTVTINAATEVALNTATLAVSGDITSGGTVQAAGDITDNSASGGKSMAQMREAHDVHEHPVNGVLTGLGSVISAPPVTQI